MSRQKCKTPVRQIGRVPDDKWKTMKAAAAARGETFTAWSVRVLLKEAVRELSKKPKGT